MDEQKKPELPKDEVDDDFLREIMSELPAGKYRPSAWHRMFQRAWRRAFNNIRARPERRKSTSRWIVAGAALGFSTLLAIYAQATGSSALVGTVCWLAWFIPVSANTFIHQGLVRTMDGVPYDRFLLPNGLSYLRMSLAPLIIPAMVVGPSSNAKGWIIALIAFIALSDLLDGVIARSRNELSRFGRVLDPIGDIALMISAAIGLQAAGALPLFTFVLLLVRYLGTFVGAVVIVVWFSPFEFKPTIMGKVTNASSSLLLALAMLAVLVQPAWLDQWLTPLLHGLAWLLLTSGFYNAWVNFRRAGRSRESA